MAKTRAELTEEILEYLKVANEQEGNGELYIEGFVLVTHTASIVDPKVSLYSTLSGPHEDAPIYEAFGLIEAGKEQLRELFNKN